jgi:ankyrin repeat protein
MRQKLNVLTLVVVLAIVPSGCSLFKSATYDTAKFQAIHQAAMDGDINKLNEILQTNPKLVNVPDYDGNTTLHLAAMRGHAEAAHFLLDQGANVNATNNVAMTPLHLAAKEGFVDVVKVLLTGKPKLDIRDSRGWTPLTWAEQAKHDDIANLLRDAGGHD